jgi:hypothetical protein
MDESLRAIDAVESGPEESRQGGTGPPVCADTVQCCCRSIPVVTAQLWALFTVHQCGHSLRAVERLIVRPEEFQRRGRFFFEEVEPRFII